MHHERQSLYSDHHHGVPQSEIHCDILSRAANAWLSFLRDFGEFSVVALDIWETSDRD